jgi:hypothetical protein
MGCVQRVYPGKEEVSRKDAFWSAEILRRFGFPFLLRPGATQQNRASKKEKESG